MKENKFAAAQMKVFLVTRIPGMSFFWPKTIRKNKATKQEMWIMSILYPKRPFGILSSSK